jgi:recombinational DNA repair protein RecT
MQEDTKLPVEYIPLINMIQKEESIRKGITALKSKILVSAGEEFQSWPEEKQNQFFERTIMTIAKDDKLIECFMSPEGKLSLIEAVEKSVSTGLQIGGKHAYLVPQGRKANRKGPDGKDLWVKEVRFSIRDRGYYALLVGGKRPIFLDLRWGQVYEKDDCTINKGTGEVKHNISISDDKGKFLGVWVQAKKINGQLEAEFYSKSKIDQWRNCSKAFQSAKNKNEKTIWDDWPEEMGLQSSIRHFCERYEEARELLASAIYDDETEEKKTGSVIDDINESLEKEEPDFTEDPPPEKKKEEKKQPESKDEEGELLDLF